MYTDHEKKYIKIIEENKKMIISVLSKDKKMIDKSYLIIKYNEDQALNNIPLEEYDCLYYAMRDFWGFKYSLCEGVCA